MIPQPWEFALLALAAFRIWRLVGDDALLDRPRDWALERATKYWADIDYFVTCPWCAGFWIALAWWGAWMAWPHAVLVAASLFALSAAVGFLGVIIDRLEG